MKTKLKIIIPAAVAVIAIIIAAVCINFTSSETVDFDSLMSTAQKYLIEHKYEQAIAEFEKVIQLDPMNVDAYLGLADAYIAVGETDKAIEVLEKGYSETGDERLKDYIDKIKNESTESETTVLSEITTLSETDVSETEPERIVVDDDWIESARSQVTDHYKNTSGLIGEFVCFPNEDIIENEFVKFILRYSISDEEAFEIIDAGGMPSGNVYQSLIVIEIKTGKVTDDSGNIWYLDFNSNAHSSFDAQNEVDLLSDFIKVVASYDYSFAGKSDDDKWHIISMLSYNKNMNYVDDSTLSQWLKIVFNDENLPSLDQSFFITRRDSGYEFAFGDPQELDVYFNDIKENSDGTISVICDVYSYMQTNTKNECEYGMLKKCEVILTPNMESSGANQDYKFRIKDVNRISSYNYAGSCGENVMYAIDENNVAYIYGSGRMDDYDFTNVSGLSSNSPFSTQFMPIVNISKIIIEEGVTYIGTCTFPEDCTATEIYFPKSVVEIGDEITRTFQGETDVWEAGLSISDKYTIYCYEDSYIHQYAIKNNLTYKLR